jgi:twitching motility protein PilT
MALESNGNGYVMSLATAATAAAGRATRRGVIGRHTVPIPVEGLQGGAALRLPAQAAAPLTDGEREGRMIEMLVAMVETGASDLHLSTGAPARVRVDGDLVVAQAFGSFARHTLPPTLRQITPPDVWQQYMEGADVDFAFELPGCARFRVNLSRDIGGYAAAVRRVPKDVPTADEVALSPAVRELATLGRGLVLVTGPSGSGKSTTLAALIDLLNTSRSEHIITIEDPVEFVHASRKCLINQREVGRTGTVADGLRSALRGDPDVVVIGELRDSETAAMAIEIAATGRLVLSSMPTSGAVSTVEHLVDQFPLERRAQIRIMLADSLRAVVSQCLLKRIGGGRVAAREVMVVTPQISDLLRAGKTSEIRSAIEAGRELGMVSLETALDELVRQRLVSPSDALEHANDRKTMGERLRRLGLVAEAAA